MGEIVDRERLRRQHEERQAELRSRPEDARIVTRAKVRIVKDYLKEAQLGKFTIRSDEHAPAGSGEAPTPLQIFVAGVGFWLFTQLARFASVMDVPIEAAEIDLRASFPTAAKYGLDPAGGAAMEMLTYTIDITSPAPRERVRELVETAEHYCHASNSLRVAVPVEGTLRLNGQAVPFSPPAPPEVR